MTDELLSPAQRFSRRELMRRGLLGGAAVALTPSLLAALEGSAAAASTATLASGTINFFSWQGYDLLDEPTVKAWRKKNGVTVHSTYVNTHNDITAKFTAGGGKGIYNLSTYEAGYGPFYVGLDIPQPLKANARLIVPSYGNMGDLFASGEILAATPGWAAVNSFAASKGDHAVKHVAPKEGSATFCDAFFIPNGAKDTDVVYAYINEAFSLEAQAQEAT